MSKESEYFDLKNEFKGWEPFIINKESVKKNIGATIAYVNKRSIDRYRGYFSIDYANDITETYYSNLIFDNGNDSVDKRDIVSCIIKRN